MNKMKNRLAALAAAAAVGISFAPALAASENDSWQMVKRAVQEESRPASARKEARWFKIIIADRGSRGGDLKVTLPLSLVEGLARLAAVSDEPRRFRCGDRELDIDVLEVLEQLKEAGPLALIEIKDDDVLIKIWIE